MARAEAALSKARAATGCSCQAMQGLSTILWRSLKNTRLQKILRQQPIISAQPIILPSQSELLAACRGYQTGRRLGNRGGQCFEMLRKMEDFHTSHLVFFVCRGYAQGRQLSCGATGMEHSNTQKVFHIFDRQIFPESTRRFTKTHWMVTLEVLICIRRSILWPSSSRFGCTSTKRRDWSDTEN